MNESKSTIINYMHIYFKFVITEDWQRHIHVNLLGWTTGHYIYWC